MSHTTERAVWVVVTPGSAPLDVAGCFDVFRRAAACSRGVGYRVELVGSPGATVETFSGFGIACGSSLDEASERGLPHTLLVAGGDPRVLPGTGERALADWLRGRAGGVERVGSICSGAFVLAAAGLLDGRRATTHWELIPELRDRFPGVEVLDDVLFAESGGVWTSAGVTAGIDMSLEMVERDLGHTVALDVARFLVLFLRRSGNQRQYSAPLSGQISHRKGIRELHPFIVEHLADDLSVDRLARACHMSPRNLSRVFKSELGMTPATFVRSVRLDEARRLLEQTDLGIEHIARAVGSGDESTLRRWFMEHFGVPPGTYRARFQAKSGSRAGGEGSVP